MHTESMNAQANIELHRDTQPAEGQLINCLLISPLQQRVSNSMTSESGQKSNKSQYSLDRLPQRQSFQVNEGQQESHHLMPEHEILFGQENSTGIRGQEDGQSKSNMGTMFEVQQRSDYSHQLLPQQTEQSNYTSQQPTSQDFDPFQMVRSFHR